MSLFGRRRDERWHGDGGPEGADRPRADAAAAAGPPPRAPEPDEITALRARVRRGDLAAAERLGALLDERDRAGQQAADAEVTAGAERQVADRLLRRAATGDPDAAHRAAAGLLRLGETAEAERLLDRAAQSGHPESAYLLAQLVRDRGDHRRAVELARRADRGGHADAARLAALWLLEDGDASAAVPLLRKVISRGDKSMIPALVSALLAVGDLDAAEDAVRPAADAGDWRAQYDLLAVRQERARRTGGDLADRDLWTLLKSAATGLLAEVAPLVEADRLEEAESLLRGPATAGDPVAMENLAIVIMRRSWQDPAVRAEARVLLEHSAALGNTAASGLLDELTRVEASLAADAAGDPAPGTGRRARRARRAAEPESEPAAEPDAEPDAEPEAAEPAETGAPAAERTEPEPEAEPEPAEAESAPAPDPDPEPAAEEPPAERMSVAEVLTRVYAVLLTDAEVPDEHRDGQEAELVPGVRVLTAFAAPDTLRLLAAPGIAALGEPPEIRRRAAENLTTLPPADHRRVETPGGAAFHRITGKTPFTASAVLVLDRTVEAVTGRPPGAEGVLVGLPTRHELVVHPVVDTSARAVLEAMAHHTAARFARGPEALHPAVFWWRAGALVPLSRIIGGKPMPVRNTEFDALLRRLPPRPRP